MGGGGGYPIFNPTKPIPIDGGSIPINNNIDWLWQLGLSTATSQELEEMLKKINSLLALKKDNSSFLNNIDFLKTSIDKNKEQSTSILNAEKVDGTNQNNYFDIFLMNLTLLKLKNVISDKLEAINNRKTLNTDLEENVPIINTDELKWTPSMRQ